MNNLDDVDKKSHIKKKHSRTKILFPILLLVKIYRQCWLYTYDNIRHNFIKTKYAVQSLSVVIYVERLTYYKTTYYL